MEEYFYSKGWSFVKQKSWGELSVEDTLRRHGKEEYTVLINSSSRPDSYIVIGKDYVIVYFLDDNLNEVLSYEFKFSKLTTDKLFLSFITSKKYGVGKAPIIIHRFKILEDGHVFSERMDYESNIVDSYEVIINTNSNYYNYPKFGCYEEFLKLDRYFDSW